MRAPALKLKVAGDRLTNALAGATTLAATLVVRVASIRPARQATTLAAGQNDRSCLNSTSCYLTIVWGSEGDV